MAVKGTQQTKKMMSVAARFAAQRENNIQHVSDVSAKQCITDSVSTTYHIENTHSICSAHNDTTLKSIVDQEK